MTSATPPSKPMPLESMKLIFKHMNVNSRVRLAQKLPELAPIEASTPLNVDQLVIRDNSISLNNTIFKIDHFQSTSFFSETDDQGEDSTYLQLTMKSGRHSKVERLLNDKHLSEAMLYLAKRLFDGRVMPINVKYLGIDKKGKSFHLPEYLKLAVKDIKVDHNAVKSLEAIKPFLHESSLPFDTVFIKGCRLGGQTDQDYKHPWIQTAKFLQILDESKHPTWLHSLLELGNNQVHLECQAFQRMEICIVIDKWIDNGREDGTWFSLGVRTVDDIKHLLVGLSARQGAVVEESLLGCKEYPGMLRIPLKHQESSVGIYVTKNSERKSETKFFSPFDINLFVFSTKK